MIHRLVTFTLVGTTRIARDDPIDDSQGTGALVAYQLIKLTSTSQ